MKIKADEISSVLKKEIEEAVQAEEYEKAAKLHEQLNGLGIRGSAPMNEKRLRLEKEIAGAVANSKYTLAATLKDQRSGILAVLAFG